jgi:hypothetical protein
VDFVARARKPSVHRDCDPAVISDLAERTRVNCRPGRPYRKWFSHQLDTAVEQAHRGFCVKARRTIKRAQRKATCRKNINLGQTDGQWCVFYVPLYGGIQRARRTYKTRKDAQNRAFQMSLREPFGKFVARKCDRPPKRR